MGWSEDTAQMRKKAPRAIRWTEEGEQIRHLGNYQDTMGANQTQIKHIEAEIRKVVNVISWKKLGRVGRKLINDLILTSKIRST